MVANAILSRFRAVLDASWGPSCFFKQIGSISRDPGGPVVTQVLQDLDLDRSKTRKSWQPTSMKCLLTIIAVGDVTVNDRVGR